MKKLLTILFVFLSVYAFGQPVVGRAGQANTVSDARLQAQFNFFVPRYADTTSANANKGIDSSGALIYTYDINGYWFRQSNPKMWVQILGSGGSGGGGVYGWLVGGNTIYHPLVYLAHPWDVGTNSVDSFAIVTSGVRRVKFYADGLHSETDSDDSIVVRKKNGYLGLIPKSGGGTTPTWQQTLTAGSTLTGSNTVNGGGFAFTLNNTSSITFQSTGGAVENRIIRTGVAADYARSYYYQNSTVPTLNFEAVRNSSSIVSRFTISPDSIVLFPNSGVLNISSLRSATTENTIIGRTSSDGRVGAITIGAGLSLSSGTLSATGGGGGIGSYQDSVANVLNYGADPTGASDSYTAFANAIATKRTVYVPKGNYLIGTTIAMANKSQKIFGEGYASRLLNTQSTGATIKVTADSCTIDGLSFTSPGPVTSSLPTRTSQSYVMGVWVDAWYTNVRNCHFKIPKGRGVWIFDPGTAAIFHNKILNNYLDSCRVGIELDFGGEYTDVVGNTGRDSYCCYYEGAAGNNNISSNSFTWNNERAMVFVGTGNWGHEKVVNNTINHNTNGLEILGASVTSLGLIIADNTFYFSHVELGGTDTVKNIMFYNNLFSGGNIIGTKAANCFVIGGYFGTSAVTTSGSGISYEHIGGSALTTKPRYLLDTATRHAATGAWKMALFDTTNKVVGYTDVATSSPGGSTTQVQFNDAGAFGGDAGLTYDKTTDALTIGGALTAGGVFTLPNKITATSSYLVIDPNGGGGSLGEFMVNSGSQEINVYNAFQIGWGNPGAAAIDAGFKRTAAAAVQVTDGSTGYGSLAASAGTFTGRLYSTQGADVASANNLSLGTDGNSFEITGTTQINLISNTGWSNGAIITLYLESGITVKHNQTTSGSNIKIMVPGAVDLVTTAATTVKAVLCEVGGTQQWRITSIESY